VTLNCCARRYRNTRPRPRLKKRKQLLWPLRRRWLAALALLRHKELVVEEVLVVAVAEAEVPQGEVAEAVAVGEVEGQHQHQQRLVGFP
jgi:hypothetical protein